AAHGEPVHLDCRNADADGNGLAILATSADTFIQPQVVADHGDAGQHVRTIADQGCAFDGGGDLSVFDHVGFGRREDELAIRDIDLAASEVHGIHTAFHGTNNVFGIVLARQHVGVGHTRHGDVLVALAAYIAGVGDAHQPCR